ncbi:MAG: hypothetical protein ACOC1K_02720 [Nanoarchaeota archaeon]
MKKLILSMLMCIMLATSVLGIVLDNPSAVGANAKTDSTKAAIGSGSWAANGNNDGIDNNDKFSLWLAPSTLFGKSITIDDIESISYQTYKETEQSGLNFYINIYTEGDINGWYDYRLTLEPMYSKNFNDITGAWNEWNTASSDNQLTIYDAPTTGIYGWYYPATLAEIQAGPINWNDYISSAPTTSIDYGPSIIKYLVVDTGSAWSDDFKANVDAITITLKDGSSETIDLEAESSNQEVPEFGVIGGLIALAGAGLFVYKRRK